MCKYYRNKISILTRLREKAYYHKYFEDNIANMKKTWEGINNLINRKRTNSINITSLRCPEANIVSSNTSEFPNIFNKYFSSIGQDLASKMPNSLKPYTDYLPIKNNRNSFVFHRVSPPELEPEVMLLPLKNSCGLYSHEYKCARHILCHPLADIINNPVETGIYSDK